MQILLYMLKLSLPGATTPSETSSPSKKRRKLDPPPVSLEDRLEAFMDKLSMWQLINTLDEGLLHRKGDRDWMQIFCEDVVEPRYLQSNSLRLLLHGLTRRHRFGTTVSAQTALLRSKIFPHSPFSDSSDSEDERATSPDLPTTKRAPSVAASTSGPRKTLEEPARSRSRSLSITLAQEREREQQREGSVGAKRKVLNREVSMKRAFKPRERDVKSSEAERKEKEKEEKQKAEEARLTVIREQERSQGVMLVAATPVKSKVRPKPKSSTSREGEEMRGGSPDPLSMDS